MRTPIFCPCATRWFDSLFGHIAAGAHENDDAIGIGSADVFVELVLASDDPGEAVHRILQDGGHGEVVGIDGLARLEVDIGILRGAAQNWTVRRERARGDAGG